jgi:hypothetical protein
VFIQFLWYLAVNFFADAGLTARRQEIDRVDLSHVLISRQLALFSPYLVGRG